MTTTYILLFITSKNTHEITTVGIGISEIIEGCTSAVLQNNSHLKAIIKYPGIQYVFCT